MGIFHWIFGKHPPRPPDPERSAEAAWLPLWLCHVVVEELHERDIPAVLSEDHTAYLRMGSGESMGRIFVMEPRLADARAVVAEIVDAPPPPDAD